MKITSLSITGQPVPVTARTGDTAAFTVTAKGPGITYQWQLSDNAGKTWRNSKATQPTYQDTLSDKNNGRYVRCVVTDKYGNTVTSDAAYMKITSLSITGQPVPVTARTGDTAAFTVTAKGPGITYQWQLSDDAGKTWRDSKGTQAIYADTLSDKNNGRYVRCVVTDKYGNAVTSDAAYMKITSLSVTEQPVPVTAKKGDTASFAVTAKGPGVTYQWQFSDDQGKTWKNSSVTSATYGEILNTLNDGRYVRCVVTDKYGNTVISDAAYMKITSLAITGQPVSVTAKKGSTVSFTVTANGPGVTYQWQYSDDQGKTWQQSSLTGATYKVTLSDRFNGRYVRCVVTDKYGNTVISDAAYMKITSLAITGQPVSVTAKKGSTVSFTVTANGPGVTYQWQYSDDQGKTWQQSSLTGATYKTTLTDSRNGRYVRCVVTDKYGNAVTSKSASMKIK